MWDSLVAGGKPVQTAGHVYMIDDDADARGHVGALLRLLKYDVKTFAKASTFFELGVLKSAAVIILDMSIPEMSGLQVHRKILEAGSTATVIYISSNCERQNIVDAMKAGAVDFLWKPLSRETLAKAVAEAMSISVTAVKLIAQQARVRAGLEQLSVREREIFTMLVSGLPNRQIATRLGVRPDTVKKHRTVICEKFLVEDTAQLIAMTLERPIYHIS
jgi:FixJ family two-component response regulator